MVGLDRPMLGRNGRALDERQKVALDAFTRDVAAAAISLTGADLVDLVQEDDAIVFNFADRLLDNLILVDQLVAFLNNERREGIFDAGAPRFRAPAKRAAEDIADRDRADRRARHIGQLEHRQRRRGLRNLDLDFLVVELACSEPLAERIARGLRSAGADKGVEHPLFRGKLRAGMHRLALLFFDHRDRGLEKITDDLLDVAADIANLGEFRRLDFQERRARKLGEAPRNLGLAAAGRPNHQNVFWQDLLAHYALEAQPAPAVAQGDRDGAFGFLLADDEPVKLGDDLARRKVGHLKCFLLPLAHFEAIDSSTKLLFV